MIWVSMNLITTFLFGSLGDSLGNRYRTATTQLQYQKSSKTIGSILLSLEFLPKNKALCKSQNQSMDKHPFFLGVQCPTAILLAFRSVRSRPNAIWQSLRGPVFFGSIGDVRFMKMALHNLQDDVWLIRRNVTFFRIFCCLDMGRLRLMAEIDQEEQISYNAIGACWNFILWLERWTILDQLGLRDVGSAWRKRDKQIGKWQLMPNVMDFRLWNARSRWC